MNKRIKFDKLQLIEKDNTTTIVINPDYNLLRYIENGEVLITGDECCVVGVMVYDSAWEPKDVGKHITKTIFNRTYIKGWRIEVNGLPQTD